MKFSMLLLALMLVVLSGSAFAVSIPISVNTTNSTITLSYESSTMTINFTADLNTTFQINYTNPINYTNSSCTIYVNTSTVNIDYELIKTKTVCSLNYSLSCPEPSCPQASCPACPTIDYATIDGNVQAQMANFASQVEERLLEVNQSLTNSFTSKSFSFPDLNSLVPYAIGAAILAYASRKKWQPLFNKATGASTTATNRGKEEAPK